MTNFSEHFCCLFLFCSGSKTLIIRSVVCDAVFQGFFFVVFCFFLHIQPGLDLLRTHLKFPGSAGWCRLWNSILLFHILPLILLFTFCSYFFVLVFVFFFKENLSHRWNAHELSPFFLFYTLCRIADGSGESLFLKLQDSVFYFAFLCVYFFLMSVHHYRYLKIIWIWKLPGTLAGFVDTFFDQWPG